jgi:hypothetical protein
VGPGAHPAIGEQRAPPQRPPQRGVAFVADGGRSEAGDGSVLVVQGRSGASLGGGSCAAAHVDSAGLDGGAYAFILCVAVPTVGDAVCLVTTMKLFWEVQCGWRGRLHGGGTRR